MAGAQNIIDLQVDDAELRAELKKLAAKMGDLTPFFRDVGETLLNSTRERFRSQTAPDGMPWAPLSPAYKKIKKKNKDKILTLDGRLRGTLAYQAKPFELLIGSPLEYAADLQFGIPEINLPARPFLGLSDDDTEMILDALNEWLLSE